jgi:AcrR family transcriptional regulator
MATQEERRLTTRTAIIEAAQRLFGSAGFDVTTMDDIAKKAGVAKGAVYHHYKNKREVFEAVFEAVSADLVATMLSKVDGGDDAVGMLVQSAQLFFDLCAEPQVSRILLQEGPAVLGHADWHRLDARHFGGLVTAALGGAMEAGAIREQPMAPLSRVILSAIQAAAIDCAAQDDFDSAAKDYLIVFRGLLEGLK